MSVLKKTKYGLWHLKFPASVSLPPSPPLYIPLFLVVGIEQDLMYADTHLTTEGNIYFLISLYII